MDEHRGRTLLVVAAFVLGSLAVALALTGWMRGFPSDRTPSASFPIHSRDMDVLTVPEAIEVQQREDAADIAVAGWFQQPFPVPCPAPLPPVTILDQDCSIAMTWLMTEPESLVHVSAGGAGGRSPTSAAVNPVFDGPGTEWANPLPQSGDSAPTPVVFVGHFDDSRAAACRPENRQACLDRFVVTAVAWASGVDEP